MLSTSKFQWIARAGYSARAIVFFLVGALALFSGLQGGKSDTRSALDALLEQPFGRIWVGLIAVGMVGFVLWRLAQSIANADRQVPGVKGIIVRSALFGSAVIYIGLAFYAGALALGLGGQNNGGGEKDVAEWAMSQSYGKYIAGSIGVGFVIGGLVTILKGALRKYERYLTSEAKASRLISVACIYGLSARGVLFIIVGSFFIFAALRVAPDQAGSISDALNWLRGLPYGGIIYAVVAVGLISFGAYNIIQARYRIVHEPELANQLGNAARRSAELFEPR